MSHSGVILLAEDNARLRKLYGAALEAAGFEVLFAADGAQALKLLYSVRPKLILLDISMPNMDGIEACRRARQMLGSQVPIVFLSAHDEVEILHDCIAAGGDDYVFKSGELKTIMERLERWLRPGPQALPLTVRRERLLANLARRCAEAAGGSPAPAAG